MARQILAQETATTKGGAVWSLTGEGLSERDHPGYAPLLPIPAPSIFLSVLDAEGRQQSYERVADTTVLAQRIASIVTLIEAMD
jgi:hypothetical protein